MILTKSKKHSIHALTFSFALLALISFFSCRKGLEKIEAPENYQPYNFEQVFEAFWQGMNRNYVFWDIERSTTNWNDVYTVYKPLFAELDINNYEDVLTAWGYIQEMTDNLSDGHLDITFNDTRLAGYSINPAQQRQLLIDPDRYITEDQLFNKNPELYFDKPYYKSGKSFNILSGTIGGNTLYLHFNSFQLSASFEEGTVNQQATKVLTYFFSTLQNENVKRVIVDLRQNAGGDVNDLSYFLSRFIAQPLKIGKIKYKSGNNKLDYTPWIDVIISPVSDIKGTSKPVTVLVDGYSASVAELTAMAFKAIPGNKVIGDTTWGATGMIPAGFNSQLYNGGPFVAAKYINVYTPAAAFQYIDGKSYERIGFPPDVSILNTNSGKDEQLEAAIKN